MRSRAFLESILVCMGDERASRIFSLIFLLWWVEEERWRVRVVRVLVFYLVLDGGGEKGDGRR